MIIEYVAPPAGQLVHAGELFYQAIGGVGVLLIAAAVQGLDEGALQSRELEVPSAGQEELTGARGILHPGLLVVAGVALDVGFVQVLQRFPLRDVLHFD
jgi:hypothetical protein